MAQPDHRSRLMAEAVEVLAANDTGRFIKPGPRQYPGQWNWDAAFNVIGLSHIDPARARQEVRSLLSGQWSDGMVPHIVFHDAHIDYFPGPTVWGTVPQMPAVPTSGITQPPLLATAVTHLHRLAPDRAFLLEVSSGIDAWHRWFFTGRLRRGLVRIVHPWESGMDNSPRFDSTLTRVGPSPIPLLRRDLIHVPADQRPRDEEYDAYLSLVAQLRAGGYGSQPGLSRFDLCDVFVTAVLCRAESDLAALWSQLGRDPEPGLQRRDELIRGLESAWDYQRKLFVDGDGGAVATIAGLLAAYATPWHHACDHLEASFGDPETFGPGRAARCYPTSVARNESDFDPRRYWRGPVWVNMNWLAIRTLEAAGHHGAAGRLRSDTLDLVAESGFWEYYDADTGEGLGSDCFSWTAALTIDLLAER